MAPKYSDKVLFRVTEDKKAVWCLMEKIHVLDKLYLALSYRAVGRGEFQVNELTTDIK